MKVEIDIPPHLMGYLESERGDLWNMLAVCADDPNHPHPTYAETVLNILEQENSRYLRDYREMIIKGMLPEEEPPDPDIPF